MPFPVEFGETDLHGRPAHDYLMTLDAKVRQKVEWTLQAIQTLDRIPKVYLDKITPEIWEVRVQFAGNIFRLLGFLHKGKLVLISGFTKKTQKAPSREIDLATQRRKRYLALHGSL